MSYSRGQKRISQIDYVVNLTKIVKWKVNYLSLSLQMKLNFLEYLKP